MRNTVLIVKNITHEGSGLLETTDVDKWRENYRFSGAAICLDEVNELGTFVEIEIMTSDENSHAEAEIKRIAKEIGVTGEPILASYLELLLSKRSAVQS